MLSFAEEIVLLLLDDASGEFAPLPQSVFGIVVAGAALMDLALRNRIDTDLEKLVVVDPTPTGDDILDDALARLVKAGPELNTTEALYDGALQVDTYKARALERLLAHGVLREESGRFLWVFRTRRYPVIDDTEQQEVRARLRQIILTDEIPDPRDVVLICLIDACALTRFVLSPEEIKATATRLDQLRKMDLIGRTVAQAASEVQAIIKFAAAAV
jgi:hypothetical protein